MNFEDLPQAVKTIMIVRFVCSGILVVLSVVFGITFKSFALGALPLLLAAAYIGIVAFITLRSVLKNGLFFTEGRLVRVDRLMNSKKVRSLYSKTDAPSSFYLITPNGTAAKIHPDGRKWRYEIGDYMRVYYTHEQKPREVDGTLIFSDYIVYEKLTVDEKETEQD